MLRNRYSLAFTAALVIFITIGIVAVRSQRELSQSIEWRAHTLEVLYQIESLNASIVDMENGVRGYLIDGKDASLSSYQTGLSAITDRLGRVRSLTVDNGTQQARVARLEPMVGRLKSMEQAAIGRRRLHDGGGGVEQSETRQATALTTKIRQVLNDMVSEERGLLSARDTQMRKDLSFVGWVFTIGGVFAAGLIAWASIVMARTIKKLQATMAANAASETIQGNLAHCIQLCQGQTDQRVLAQIILTELAKRLPAECGCFYLAENVGETAIMSPIAGHAIEITAEKTRWRLNQGLVGQCARDRKRLLITNAPPEYIRIESGLGSARPCAILLQPVIFEDKLLGVFELASFVPFSESGLTFLSQFADSFGMSLNNIQTKTRTDSLLQDSQTLTEELQAQQEELQQTNVELGSQAEQLRQSQELLRQRQSELESANAQLDLQRRDAESRNRELEVAQAALQERAEQLALSSKYKSSFLANMSHELRTPLNSVMLLSRILTENNDRNLSKKQLQYLNTIHESGKDLLSLINEILDLARIESGKMILHPEPVRLADLADTLEKTFRPLAEEKGLHFHVETEPQLPETLTTDPQRLAQILRNLLSNACKFTSTGGITLRMRHRAPSDLPPLSNPQLRDKPNLFVFSVTDTGIGISPDKQDSVWEVFQQAESTTNRKFGGSGLGLTICRELARLLNGEMQLVSATDEGSTFTLLLPAELAKFEEPRTANITKPAAASALPTLPTANTDHPFVIIVEPDTFLAAVIRDLSQEHGCTAAVAESLEAAWEIARDRQPDALIVDKDLPPADVDKLLSNLQSDHSENKIPLHIIAPQEESLRKTRDRLVAVLDKPIERSPLQNALSRIDLDQPRILVVEDNTSERDEIISLLTETGASCAESATGAEALTSLDNGSFDCLILDLHLPDMDGFDVLEKIQENPAVKNLPVIVYTAQTLSEKQIAQLERHARAIIIKGPAAPDRLIDETTRFLKHVAAGSQRLPEIETNGTTEKPAGPFETAISGKSVLIVDDDIRNIYAMTSALENYGVTVHHAQTGPECLEFLDTDESQIDAVLMDIMMPEMDGHETIRHLRANPRFSRMPIIAVTAKAMQGDRDDCLASGASDYLTKPVDLGRLRAVLGTWLASN